MGTIKSMAELFDQLGLSSAGKDIEEFACKNRIAQSGLLLYKANFWSKSQADFLQENWVNDSEWVAAIDELDQLLRD